MWLEADGLGRGDRVFAAFLSQSAGKKKKLPIVHLRGRFAPASVSVAAVHRVR